VINIIYTNDFGQSREYILLCIYSGAFELQEEP